MRSFKSFIQTVPPNPGVDDQKPLPPTPSDPSSALSECVPTSPTISYSAQSPSNTSWQPPNEWKWDNPCPPSQPTKTIPIAPARTYSPLLPDPLPRSLEMELGKSTWSEESDLPPHPQLRPMPEVSYDTPTLPPRNPYRLSVDRNPSDESNLGSPNKSLSSLAGSIPSLNEEFSSYHEHFAQRQLHTKAPAASKLDYQVSNASTKVKAFASLGIGSPRNTKPMWENRTTQADTPQVDDGPVSISLRGKRLQPLIRESLDINNDVTETELRDKLQHLSFSQDYHNALADQYHGSQAEPTKRPVNMSTSRDESERCSSSRPRFPARSEDLIPRPLTWRKSSESSSSTSSLKRRSEAEPESTSRKIQKKMAAWVPHHLYNTNQQRSTTEEMPSTNRVADLSRDRVPEAEVDRLLKKSARFPKLLSHAKGLGYHKKHSKIAAESASPSSLYSPVTPISLHHHQSAPILRFPGGFALVRHSPANTPRTEPSSMEEEILARPQHQDSYSGSPLSYTSELCRPSSSYSRPQVPVAPGMAIASGVRNSSNSLRSCRRQSSSLSLPPSPLTHEISFPRTPSPIPSARPHVPHLPLWSRTDKGSQAGSDGNSMFDGTPKQGIVRKAKEVRDAWKKRQMDVKHDKLKQSIRIVGPLDISEAYKRDGRFFVDDDARRRRIPGYIISEPMYAR